MSTANAPKTTTPLKRPLLPPPEEFWKKYSARHEFPFSTALSVFLHALAIGLILLVGYLAQLRWNRPEDKPPDNDVVMMAGDGPEGGSGNPGLPGDGKAPGEVVMTTPGLEKLYGMDFAPESSAPDESPSVDLDPSALKEEKDDGTDTAVIEILKKLGKEPEAPKTAAPPVMSKKTPVRGEGGVGGVKGGGLGFGGKGFGTGVGDKFGPGKGRGGFGRPLTRQEFLAQRWNFDLSGPPNIHLDKLTKIGFIVGLEGMDGRFYTIDNIKSRPVALKLDNQDKYKEAVRWYNRHPPSVEGVTKEMGVSFPVKHIVLILPRDREKKLVDEEVRYAASIRQSLKDFDYIWFDFRLKGAEYEPHALRVGKGSPLAGPG